MKKTNNSSKKQKMTDQKSGRKKILNYLVKFWLLFFAILFVVVLFFYGIIQEWFGPMPTFEELENPESNLATEIYSSDNVLLGTFFF